MKTFKKMIAVVMLVSLAVACVGCKYESNLVIKDAKKDDIAMILKDFAGINGYRVTYANDQTGTYRIFMGHSATRSIGTSDTYTVFNSIGEKDNKTLVGQSSTINTTTPSQNLTQAIAVQMTQQDSDVVLAAQSTGEIDAGDNFEVFIRSLKNRGYAVEITD